MTCRNFEQPVRIAAGLAAAAIALSACAGGTARVSEVRFIEAHRAELGGHNLLVGSMWAVRAGGRWYQVDGVQAQACAPGARWPDCAGPGHHRRLTDDLRPAE